MAELFDQVVKDSGRLDVVVRTTGIHRVGELAQMELADFDAIRRVNVRGTFVVDQQAARTARHTRILAKKRRHRDITVNAVAPAPTAIAAFLASTPCDEQDAPAAIGSKQRQHRRVASPPALGHPGRNSTHPHRRHATGCRPFR
jgi:3-oxoacyl-[acyl-carrier protein] reductase